MAEDHPLSMVTCTAPINIAVIKYWGKRDEKLILPINSSLSVTLHQDQLKTTTTAAISRDFTEDRLWLNGKESDIGHPRLQSCLREIRRLARKRRSGDNKGTGGGESSPLSLTYKVHIASENNFPTAAGLASSAAGYACLVYTLAKLYGVEGDLSEVARMGSGSACRSMFGGFVQWIMGEDADGKDSIAEQVAPETHWPEMRILILVVSAEKKPIGSTAGMQTSVETSHLLKHRAEKLVPEYMVQMMRHIQRRDFEAFGELTMKDSNQFHATCLDTFPPIFYLNDVSKQVVRLVHRFNDHYGKTKVGIPLLLCPFRFLKGLPVEAVTPPEELLSAVVKDPAPGAIQYLLLTKPGPGPAVVDDGSCHLLGLDGQPRNSSG
nr:diphosphomevalonate decarboxylase [Anolis sagrei ordinatus]